MCAAKALLSFCSKNKTKTNILKISSFIKPNHKLHLVGEFCQNVSVF